MVEEIQEWLSGGQDYRKGVMLYLQYGKFHMLKNLFQKSENNYNREKLLHELKELVRGAGSTAEESSNVDQVLEGISGKLGTGSGSNIREQFNLNNRPSGVENKHLHDAEMWSLYKDLEIQRNKLSNYYHILFKSNASQKELADHYQVIEEKSKEMVEIWERIHNTGKTPEAKEDKETLMRWKKRLIDQKYKLKKKLENEISYPVGSSKRKMMEQEVVILEAKTEEIFDKIKKL